MFDLCQAGLPQTTADLLIAISTRDSWEALETGPSETLMPPGLCGTSFLFSKCSCAARVQTLHVESTLSVNTISAARVSWRRSWHLKTSGEPIQYIAPGCSSPVVELNRK